MSSPLPNTRSTLFSDSIPYVTYLKARVQRVFRRRFCRRNSGDLGGIALDDAEKGHRVRGCARASSVRRLTWIFAGIMFGTVVCLVLAFYAWNVEVLWGGEMAPGRYRGGVWLGGLQNHTGEYPACEGFPSGLRLKAQLCRSSGGGCTVTMTRCTAMMLWYVAYSCLTCGAFS